MLPYPPPPRVSDAHAYSVSLFTIKLCLTEIPPLNKLLLIWENNIFSFVNGHLTVGSLYLSTDLDSEK